jgi:precorrin-6A/cobalt-precorrin-6A reductase
MTETILILGGTREAAKLAMELTLEKPAARVISSLAGRTKEPKPLAGETRIGGFGGAEGLARWLSENQVTRLIDATHPFATQISANAQAASQVSGVPLEIRQREPWVQLKDDIWLEAETLADAASVIPTGARVLLALGSQHLAPFANRSDVFYLVRMVDAPEASLALPDYELILGKPSTDWQIEANTLTGHDISHIVCRNSGGKGAYAKIEAARHLQLPIIMVQRPS